MMRYELLQVMEMSVVYVHTDAILHILHKKHLKSSHQVLYGIFVVMTPGLKTNKLAAALRIGEAQGLEGEGLQQNASTKCHLTGVCTKSQLTE